MTVFENIKSKNVDELVEWIVKNGAYDNAQWEVWFNNNYCKKCEVVIDYTYKEYLSHEFSWCELHNKCRFFQNMDRVPDRKQVIELWLNSRCE